VLRKRKVKPMISGSNIDAGQHGEPTGMSNMMSVAL
jgi:hypothetical protein